MKIKSACAIGAAALMESLVVAAEAEPADKFKLNTDESVEVPGFLLPFSAYASPEARQSVRNKIERIQKMRSPEVLAEAAQAANPIAGQRLIADKYNFTPSLEAQKRRYAVTMATAKMGGVEVQIFTPKSGVSAANKSRVLINLHGGGMVVGWPLVSQIESIPVASVGNIKVISVNYGMFPEARFPRASQDVAAVYKELLKTYRPSQIGIYGCSAGGFLASASMAWFEKEKLPKPAAIAMISSALDPSVMGDSAYVTPRMGSVLPAPKEPRPELSWFNGYFSGADPNDPLAWPSRNPKVFATYPPTLLMTGTRAGDMSAAANSHVQLLRSGVDARLVLWDGLDHCFLYDPDMPESEQAYQIIADFLQRHMRGSK